MIELTLPYPPSTNTYWRLAGRRFHISQRGQRYRQQVAGVVLEAGIREPLTGRLSVEIVATMPDHRSRDLDNVQKALLDALEKAGVYEDDEQIDDLRIRRGGVQKPGAVDVFIS